MAPLTGFFGANSSGKTSILQFLLMLKQTVESSDRSRILEFGEENPNAYINLGNQADVSYKHQLPGQIRFSLTWQLPDGPSQYFHLDSEIDFDRDSISLAEFRYEASRLPSNQVLYGLGLERLSASLENAAYTLVIDPGLGTDLHRVPVLGSPPKGYEFPTGTTGQAAAAGFQIEGQTSQFVGAYEDFLEHHLYYLGPLRESPQRLYRKITGDPINVGQRGEFTIRALLSSRSGQQDLVIKIAEWLRQLNLIYDFKLHPIADNRSEYEVRVRRTANAPEVLITDVGFGVSQVLPVLVLCHYAPPGSTIIFEQPEIHLHPAIQSGLADVFIDVIKTRGVQIILESHSEHLLNRLQRRIAEEEFSNDNAALYFCSTGDEGTSHLTALDLDSYGNINNWPKDFFGDEMGDLVAMSKAALHRQVRAGA